MAIKTETQDKQAKEISFPCLMRGTDTGIIVLFSDVRTGTVVHTGDQNDYPVGTYATDWGHVTNPYWELSPPVTISNI